jgi:hypothetical protein
VAGYRFCDHCGAAPKTETKAGVLEKDKKDKEDAEKKKKQIEEESKKLEAEKKRQVEETKRKKDEDDKKKRDDDAERKQRVEEAKRNKDDEEKKKRDAEDQKKKEEKQREEVRKKEDDDKQVLVRTMAKGDESRVKALFFGPGASEVRQAQFVAFLRQKHCSEIGLFLVELARFKKLDKGLRSNEARRIAAMFVALDNAGASNEWDNDDKQSAKLNLSGALVAAFKRELEMDPSSTTVFDLIELDCLQMCHNNNFDEEFFAKVYFFCAVVLV